MSTLAGTASRWPAGLWLYVLCCEVSPAGHLLLHASGTCRYHPAGAAPSLGRGPQQVASRGYALAAVATSWLQFGRVAAVEVGNRSVTGSCNCQPASGGIQAAAGPCRVWAARSLGLLAFQGWCSSSHMVLGWLGPWGALHPCHAWEQCLFSIPVIKKDIPLSN